MGTHPIFESDFDCLTDLLLKMSEEDPMSIYWRHFDIRQSDKLYWILGSFHISHFGLLWFSWNRENLQIGMFIVLGCLMFCSEKLNEILAQQRWLAHTNYFDSSGMFFYLCGCHSGRGQSHNSCF